MFVTFEAFVVDINYVLAGLSRGIEHAKLK